MPKWFRRLLNVCLKSGEVSKDWRISCVKSVYKGKGYKSECSSCRVISLLSIPVKVNVRIIIDRVEACAENKLDGEQCGFQ